ncbi:OmpA family protein [Novilysobacter selenitireducens]|uniref:OmpA family protein n=1 Tax=Novilysobacter selenitireducens TaxID=2872639 RepID=A0ABS7T5H5_9GAMM|nr:OmpA family protein [Lysobacter selenitireducens]MBZ4039108.1 OmpA family protein [Lysobacter selenitireducens]
MTTRHPRRHRDRPLGLLLVLLCGAPLHAQQDAPRPAAASPQLVPAGARITDEAMQSDYSTYQATQDRIQALNDAGRPLRDYHLAKAQCWLDTSFHEYSRNDRSDFPQAALEQAGQLVTAMERGTEPMPMDTPLVNGALRLRADLWTRLGTLHGSPGFKCAQQQVACAEVELVHAGNEFNQQQWRHAKPYIQVAEELLDHAEASARTCMPMTETSELPATVLFGFDRYRLDDIHAGSLATLDRVLQRIGGERLRLTAVTLVGHADRLPGTTAEYNLDLSRKRVLTVRDYLVEHGVASALIKHSVRGDQEQVQTCDGVRPQAALEDCLLPNRRVEAVFHVERTVDSPAGAARPAAPMEQVAD